MKNKKQILGFDIDALIKESIANIFEVSSDESTENMKEKLRQQEKAKQSSNRRKKMKEDPTDKSGDESPDLSAEKPVKIKHEKVPEINAKAIKDKIDNIRAGKSLKDKKTNQALKSYFQKLNGPERIALFAFLSGLEKILGKAATDVKTPHSAPYNIDMEQEERNKQNLKVRKILRLIRNQKIRLLLAKDQLLKKNLTYLMKIEH